jgi:outer membrane protein OmpA-like peptidoglycan-associated protein
MGKSFLGAVAASVLLAAVPASAQQLALDRFDPAPAGDRFFGVQSPFAAGALTPHVMALLDYAHDPLVIRSLPSNTNLGAVVSSQLYLHINGGLSLWNRLNINVDLPIAVYQNGDGTVPGVGGLTFVSPSKADFGDLRIGLRVRLFGEYHDPFQIGIGGYLWVPTGKGAFVTNGQVRGLPQLILGGRGDERVVWTAAVGPQIQNDISFAGVQQSSMLKYGAGIAVLLGQDRQFQIGPEVSGTVSFTDVQKRTTNLEALLGARYRIVHDFEVGLAGGPGLTSGIGTPDFRGVLSVAYTPEPILDRDHDGIPDSEDACPDVKGIHTDDPKTNGCPPPKDRDGDKILDDDDACPDEPGPASADPKKNGCPLPKDRDGDGIPDSEDACPDVKGVRTNDPKTNGCPPDRDGDGIIDSEDACPDVKGIRTDDPKTNGCPPPPKDTDGDGIVDSEDACPNEKGPRTNDPKTNGCPQKVRVTDKEIFILEQVQFDTGKATIKKVSDGLLDEVAGVLKEHPEITKLEVQGHTDTRGLKAQNKILSQARADAVRKAMIKRGIDAKRLTAKGYGQDVPIADNNTDEGRQKNRRVQFTITEKQPKK